MTKIAIISKTQINTGTSIAASAENKKNILNYMYGCLL